VIVSALPPEAQHAVETIKQADIVIGIPSFNNARTIGHVVKACYAGLSKYFPELSSVVINRWRVDRRNPRNGPLGEPGRNILMLDAAAPAHRLSFLSRDTREGQRISDGL
jgi:hypothetical protein